MYFFVGIDFSINYPAIVIKNYQEKKLDYLAFFRNNKLSKKHLKIIEILNELEEYHSFNLPERNIIDKTTDYSNKEKIKSFDCNKISQFIPLVLSLYLNEVKSKNINIAIEGFSFASRGSANNELIGYQYVLRNEFIKRGWNFEVFAPMTIKKTAGKGNFNKNEMIEAFLNNTTNDEELTKSNLIKKIKENEKFFKTKTKWQKPVEDIIDAYWVMRHNELLQQKL